MIGMPLIIQQQVIEEPKGLERVMQAFQNVWGDWGVVVFSFLVIVMAIVFRKTIRAIAFKFLVKKDK